MPVLYKEMFSIKKVIALMLALLLTLFLAACGANEDDAQDDNSPIVQLDEVFKDAEELTYNPLTGEALPSGAAAGRRPVAIMVNNASAGLPQRGLAAADAMLEMVTEGGITRLMALYSDASAVPQVGPVRSARDQHVQFAIPLNAIVVHIGTSIYAENLINTYAYQGIDGRYLGPTCFWFDEARATTRASEHCWYTDANLIAAGIAHENLAQTGKSFPLLPFVDNTLEPVIPEEGDAPDSAFQFSADNQVRFTYQADTGLYTKMAYGAPHADEEGEQLSYKNVLILFAEVGMKEDNYCTDFNLVSGYGYYLYGGKYRKILWQKGNPENPLKITDEQGKEVQINTGKSYIGVVGSEWSSSLVLNMQIGAEPAAGEDSSVAQ